MPIKSALQLSTFLCLLLVSPFSFSEILIDGKLDEAEWDKAREVTKFYEVYPFTLEEPKYDQKVLVLEDEKGIYFGFINYQSTESIRSNKHERDLERPNADRVGVNIDFDGDNISAYSFSLSVSGSKGDGTYKNENDIVVLEKKDIAAGASGIACGVVRNNYFQPAMRELMAHSVSVWESDPKAFKYNSVGYLQISPEVMHEDVASIAEQQKAIGYDSEFIEGEADCMKYMKNMFGDWQAQGITSVLHEKKGGYAFNKDSIKALEEKSTSNGVKVIKGVTVTGFKKGSSSKSVTGVETDKGIIECDQVVVGAGPWVRDFWNMLELPKTAKIKDKDGKFHETEMWKYWMLQEGVIGVDENFLKMDNGGQPPVIHVDSTAPLYSDKTKKLITDKIWGIYYKPDIEGLGVQGGTSPYIVDKHFDKVNVDPYGVESPEFQTTEAFNDMWCSALAHCQKRFEGKSDLYRKGPSGGLGCMTPDSFPIFDKFLENVYMIADANHGYKMIGVGELVAKEILGTESDLLKPFRFNRYEKGELHPTSNSPFPWS